MTSLIAIIIAVILTVTGFVFYTQTSPTPQDTVENTQEEQPQQTLATINRSGQNLTKISKDDILAMGNIQQLDLSNNHITGALPAEIRHLANLEVLNISNNEMTGLPAEVGQLTKLRILNAANNQLTGIPHEIGNLRNLEVLNLSGNDISEQDLNVIRAKLPASVQILL